MADSKNDLNRLGIFQEMAYISIQDPYVPSSKFNFNEPAYKGKQMLPGPARDKCTGLQDGYFAKTFTRVFEKEAYSDPVGNRRRQRVEALKKNVSKQPFITFQGDKKPEGLGSNYGTLGGKVDYFSPKQRDPKPKDPEKPNVKTNPPKKGTGYGYAAVGFDKYPENKGGDKYDRVDELSREALEQHKKDMVAGPFKSGKYHKELFDKNPFLTEKDGAVNREIKKSTETIAKPFKRSSPPKDPTSQPNGTFTQFPLHMQEPFKPHTNYDPIKEVVNSSGKKFTPHQGPKSKPQTSVINQNVAIKINANNFRNALSYSTYNLKAVSSY